MLSRKWDQDQDISKSHLFRREELSKAGTLVESVCIANLLLLCPLGSGPNKVARKINATRHRRTDTHWRSAWRTIEAGSTIQGAFRISYRSQLNLLLQYIQHGTLDTSSATNLIRSVRRTCSVP
jgi:hypothetical protein